MKNKVPFTVGFAHNGAKVLLGRKKVRLCAGKWNGFGGNFEPGESEDDCLKREFREESGLAALAIEKMGFLEIEDDDNPFIVQLHCFAIKEWKGRVQKSDEMEKLTWFDFLDIPFWGMRPADVIWLRMLLAGKKFQGRVKYDACGLIVSVFIEAVSEL